MNKNLQRLAEPGVGMYVFFLVVFAAVNLFFKLYIVAAAEVGVILLLLVYAQFAKRKRAKQLTNRPSKFSRRNCCFGTSSKRRHVQN